MLEIEKIAENLFDKIRSRFTDISIGDETAKATVDPTKARFFNFNFVTDDTEFGNITISLIDSQSLKIYYDQEIDRKMTKQQQYAWYSFLKDLRLFAKRNLLTFDIRDIAKSGLNVKDLQHLNKDADVYSSNDITESKLYGTTRSSYQQLESVRIIARHSKPVDEQQLGARARNIKAIYIENSEGERFKLPEGTTLNGARAYARHVKNGGMIHDEFGQHISQMIKEMSDLKLFARNMRGKTFEDAETMAMVEAAIDHYGTLHRDLFGLRGQKGYERYRECWTGGTALEEINLDELKDRFTRRVFDERLTDALPLVYKAYQDRKNSVGEEFESWADDIVEGTWATLGDEEDDEELNSQGERDKGLMGDDERDEDDVSENLFANDMDEPGNNNELDELFTKNGFEFTVQDGKYYFESSEELERAKDIIASFDPNMEFPPMAVKGQNNTYGASTNDFELGGYSSGVMEDTMGMKDPIVVIYDASGKYLDKLNLSAAASKYNLNASSVKQQLQNQDMTKVGNLTISTPMSGQSVEEDQLNELDILAPNTTYFKMSDGSFIKADWRSTQSLTNDHASFAKFERVSPQVAQELGLNNKLNRTIASNNPGSAGPLTARSVNVVDLDNPSAILGDTTPDGLKSKLVQWVQSHPKQQAQQPAPQQAQQPAPVAEDFDISFIKILAGLTK